MIQSEARSLPRPGFFGALADHLNGIILVHLTGINVVSQNLIRVFEAAQALSDAERQELRRLLDDRAMREWRQTDNDELDQLLRQRGVSRTVPPKPTPESIARFKSWRPINMPGGSLSDDLIRDRR
jgi:hypothetical protein